MEEEKLHKAVALIVGVTGMAGVTLAETLNKSTTLGGPWTIYGASRRPLPSWFPSDILHQSIIFDATDSEDTLNKISPLSSKITHLFWLAIHVCETEQQNISINSIMLANVLNAFKSSTDSRLCHVTLQTGTKHYMGPFFDPILSSQITPHEPPFREDYPRLPFPNFYYALEDILASFSPKSFSYSIHRSSIIIGASSRSFYNLLLALSIYATICKRERLPFRYLGNKYTWEHFCDMTDARVLAEQHVWAAVTVKAKNQAFNCTNGDLFTWKSVWRVLSNVFDIEFIPFDEAEKVDVAGFVKDKAKVWDQIVEEHGLHKTRFEEMFLFGISETVLKFTFQHVSCMNKSREYGFFGYADTLKSIETWVRRLRQMKILPWK